jgi:beta-glucosidase
MRVVTDPDPGGVGELDLSGLPAGFTWGAATAAFQIEGAADQRGRSIWDRFCTEPGRIADGSDGLVACDHVKRYQRDVALMGDLGIDAYRFSVAWPRVQPGGRGPFSREGLAFYDRLVDELLGAGITPWVTLYHWDLPEDLQIVGGWAGRGVVDAFADYAVAVHAALGDRVRHWATLNEPWCSAWLGHGSGVHAPGIRNHARAARAAHHLLLAHGRAVAGMRAQAPADHRLGIVLNLAPVVVDPRLPADVATRLEPDVRRIDAIHNRWWLDALFTGRYPDDALDVLERHLDGLVSTEDLAEIGEPIDFLGVNYYNDTVVAPADPPGRDDAGQYPGVGGVRPADPTPDATSMGWPVTPDGLRRILLRVTREYPSAPPLVVTENGSAWEDRPEALAADGPVPDPRRVAYLRAHLASMAQAVREGADVRGYFAWSLMDNFEWAYGYTQRFGLLRVDYATLERRPRTSFTAYRDIIASTRLAPAP